MEDSYFVVAMAIAGSAALLFGAFLLVSDFPSKAVRRIVSLEFRVGKAELRLRRLESEIERIDRETGDDWWKEDHGTEDV